jgi:release factor glutamine methyltransferase
MKTVGDVLRLSLSHVQKHQGRPRHEVEEWIASILGLKRLDLYLQFDRPLEDNEIDLIRPGIQRLAADEPLAHILKLAPFYGFDFVVSKDVLIPRPETEILIDEARKFLQIQEKPGVIFDVCTGSGCIGICLKKLFPDWHVVLSDISPLAISLARQNAERLGVDVEIIQGSLLEPFGSRKANCIICNPPYLSSSEWRTLDLSVKDYEPRLALEAGPTGLECYTALFSTLPSFLEAPAIAIFEIGHQQKADVLALASSVTSCASRFVDGQWHAIKDFSGNDRAICFSMARDAHGK